MLRYAADIRPIAFNILYFGLLVTAFALPWEPWWIGVGLLALLCVTAFQGAVQTHNAIHSPIFKSRALNRAYQIVLTLIYGHPVSSYVAGHNLSHHRFTQKRQDVMRTTKARWRYNLLNLFFFMPSIVPDIVRGDTSYMTWAKKNKPRFFRQFAIETAVLWAVTIALLVVDWQKTLVFWVVPHFYGQWGIVTMNLLQHDGCDEDSEWNHSRNFVGRLTNWIVFNNGYHTIHHMTPGLHWSVLPEAHAEQVAPYIHPNLDQKSLGAYIMKAFVLNRRQRYDGAPLELSPVGKDEPWHDLLATDAEAAAAHGAMS